MDRTVMLTTEDNPFDPYSQFDEWYSFDTHKGYNTCSYLARIARTSEALTDQDNDMIIENAIDEIVRLNLTGNYKKLVYENGKLIPTSN